MLLHNTAYYIIKVKVNDLMLSCYMSLSKEDINEYVKKNLKNDVYIIDIINI